LGIVERKEGDGREGRKWVRREGKGKEWMERKREVKGERGSGRGERVGK